MNMKDNIEKSISQNEESKTFFIYLLLHSILLEKVSITRTEEITAI